MDEVKIRHIEPRDVDAFHGLLDSVARERKYLATLEAPPMEQTREFVMGNINQGHPQYVAERGGELIGWADLAIGRRASTRHTGSLGMGVAEGYRGQGIGRRLLQAVIDHGWNMGLKRIELEVFTNNTRAVALYESMGFEHEGRLRCARLIDGYYRDVFHMAMLHPDIEGGA